MKKVISVYAFHICSYSFVDTWNEEYTLLIPANIELFPYMQETMHMLVCCGFGPKYFKINMLNYTLS